MRLRVRRYKANGGNRFTEIGGSGDGAVDETEESEGWGGGEGLGGDLDEELLI